MTVQTNWCVITGGPSSGKTTLIDQLAKAGHQVAPEVARDYIKKMLANNYTLDEIRHDSYQLQRGILAMALKRERQLERKQTLFFDRGTPDSLGYFRYYQLDAQHVSHSCQHTRYRKIFYCHQLPLEYDAIRLEDSLSAKMISDYIYEAYLNLGYDLIELPPISVEERIHIILSHLQLS